MVATAIFAILWLIPRRCCCKECGVQLLSRGSFRPCHGEDGSQSDRTPFWYLLLRKMGTFGKTTCWPHLKNAVVLWCHVVSVHGTVLVFVLHHDDYQAMHLCSMGAGVVVETCKRLGLVVGRLITFFCLRFQQALEALSWLSQVSCQDSLDAKLLMFPSKSRRPSWCYALDFLK